MIDKHMNVPFVDLKAQYADIQSEIDDAIKGVIRKTAFVRGEYVNEFERQFAAKTGRKHCISVGNGTDAIFVTLRMLGIGAGDEVITTAASWIATSETISLTGATPVFVDIEPDCYCIDAGKIKEKITGQTKALLPVHLYGQAADMTPLCALCEEHGLHLVEDCAQAHFAEYRGRGVGTFGIAGTFSFYPGKNLGAYGDAGAVVTDDDELAQRVRMFANHGALTKHEHEIEGINSRMDGLQAAVLLAKLPHIDEWNAKRRRNAAVYSEALKSIDGVVRPAIRPETAHVFHVYGIRTSNRDKLQQHLKARGISTGIHYPTALPFLAAYRRFAHEPGDFPAAYLHQQTTLSLPMYPELNGGQQGFIADAIREFAERHPL